MIQQGVPRVLSIKINSLQMAPQLLIFPTSCWLVLSVTGSTEVPSCAYPLAQIIQINKQMNIPFLDPQNPTDEVRLFISLNYNNQNQQIACLGRVKSRITNLNIFNGEVSQPLQNESGQNISQITYEASLYETQGNNWVKCYRYSPLEAQSRQSNILNPGLIGPNINPSNQLNLPHASAQPGNEGLIGPNINPHAQNNFQSVSAQPGNPGLIGPNVNPSTQHNFLGDGA
jgi:hypothetical protein